MKKSNITLLRDIQILLSENISKKLLNELNDKLTVTNKDTGNSYEVSKDYYNANKAKYDIAKPGNKPIGGSPESSQKPKPNLSSKDITSLSSVGNTNTKSTKKSPNKPYSDKKEMNKGIYDVAKERGRVPNPFAKKSTKQAIDKQLDILNNYKPLTPEAMKGLQDGTSEHYFNNKQKGIKVPKEVSAAAKKANELMKKLTAPPVTVEIETLYKDNQKVYDIIQNKAHNGQIDMHQMRILHDIERKKAKKKAKQIFTKYGLPEDTWPLPR